MKDSHNTQVEQVLTQCAAQYFARESNGTSLITVTRTDLSSDSHRARIYLSVFPASAQESVLHFARRSRAEFRAYIHANTRIGRAPTIDFLIDPGEQHAARISELTK